MGDDVEARHEGESEGCEAGGVRDGQLAVFVGRGKERLYQLWRRAGCVDHHFDVVAPVRDAGGDEVVGLRGGGEEACVRPVGHAAVVASRGGGGDAGALDLWQPRQVAIGVHLGRGPAGHVEDGRLAVLPETG